MKEFDLSGITYLRPVREGTDEWYYALDYPDGDLYEAEELFEDGLPLEGNNLYLIHYPDGAVIKPVEQKPNVALGEPVYSDGHISFAAVDFPAGRIIIYRFDCAARRLETLAELPLSDVKDCYNLRLFEHPLTLTRQANDGFLELVWPVHKSIAIGPTESFFFRQGRRLFFSAWYEDPDYREELIIRDADTGEILEKQPGDIQVMPNGELWYLKS